MCESTVVGRGRLGDRGIDVYVPTAIDTGISNARYALPMCSQHTFTVTHPLEFSRQIDFRLCVTLSLVAVVAVEIFCLYPPDQPEGGVLELSCSKKPEYRAKKILLGMQNAYMMVPCK